MQKYNSSGKTDKLSRKKIIILCIVLLMLFALGLHLAIKTNMFGLTEKKNPKNESESHSINYDPPTEEEKESGDKQKDDLVENQYEGNENQVQSISQSATVIITDAAQYGDVIEVRSFIQDHYEDGTCTITFTQGAKKVEKETSAYRDASTTICTNPLFKRNEFPTSGDWDVVVSYVAGNTVGVSAKKVVSIQ